MMQIDRYTCEHAVRLLDDFLDRELTPLEMQRVQEHLDICSICAAEFRFEARTIQVVRARMQRISIPPGLHDRIAGCLARARAEMETSPGVQTGDTAE